MKELIKKEEYVSADYLIIYGCHIKKVLEKRLEHALTIIKTKEIDKIVLTGGVGLLGTYNESKYMQQYLLEKGIKQELILEDKSRTTVDNNKNIKKVLELEKVDKPITIVLVSQKDHLLRIKKIWEKILQNDNVHFYYDSVE